jgi:hypothetical protein
MSQASDYLEEALLNHCLRHVAYTSPTTVYCALYTADPTDANVTANEVVTTGGSLYARQAITFAAAANPGGTCTTSADLTFPVAGSNWGTVTHVGITDNATRATGNLLFYGQLDTSKTINTGDQFKILAGNLTVTLA